MGTVPAADPRLLTGVLFGRIDFRLRLSLGCPLGDAVSTGVALIGGTALRGAPPTRRSPGMSMSSSGCSGPLNRCPSCANSSEDT
jgi:hypothetical protein